MCLLAASGPVTLKSSASKGKHSKDRVVYLLGLGPFMPSPRYRNYLAVGRFPVVHAQDPQEILSVRGIISQHVVFAVESFTVVL